MTRLDSYNCEDLVLLAKNCSESLVALKVGDCPFRYLVEIFRYADRLEDFGGGEHIDEGDRNYVIANFPPKIRSIALSHGGLKHFAIPVFAHQLTKLDLTCSKFDIADHRLLVSKCPNLEELYTSDAIGD